MNNNMVHITIDGKSIQRSPVQRYWVLLMRTGLNIRKICYVPEVDPIQTCDTCIVEVDGKLMRSCSTIATEGMNIERASVRAKKHKQRRWIGY